MNKSTILPLLAAASLLAGCRTTQTNHARRGVLSGASQRVSAPSRIQRTPRPAPVQTVSGTISETPLAPQPVVAQTQPIAVQPQPVVVQPQPVVVQPQPVVAQPQPVAAQPRPAAVQPQPVAPASAPAFETYVVKRGDVAGRIANSHGMTLKEFREANCMTLEQAGKLREGQKVKVWAGASPLAAGPAAQPTHVAATDAPNVYVVQPGDTLLGISAKTGVPVATLMSNNGIDNPNAIRVGRKLSLRKGATVAPTTTKPVAPTTTTPVAPTTTKPVAPTTTKPVAPTTTKPVTTTTPAPPPVTVQPPQDASVPLEEVKVAGTDLSVADILDGASLSDAREQAETKKDEVAKQVKDAVQNAADAANAAGDAPAGYRYYVVKEGETLYHLGARYKVPFKTLRELNGLPAGASKLEAGTRLLIPDVDAAVP